MKLDGEVYNQCHLLALIVWFFITRLSLKIILSTETAICSDNTLSSTFGGQDKILSNKPVYQELSNQHYLLKYLTFKTSQQIVPCSLFQLPGVFLNSHRQELSPTSPSDHGCLAWGSLSSQRSQDTSACWSSHLPYMLVYQWPVGEGKWCASREYHYSGKNNSWNSPTREFQLPERP